MNEAQRWSLEDTFEHWLEKYNSFLDIAGNEINFRYLDTETVGLTVEFGPGQIRNGSTVEDLTGATLTFPADSSLVVGVYKVPNDVVDVPSEIAVYALGDVPEDFFVPLYAFVTGPTGITTSKDLRTPFSYGTGGSAGAGALMFFDQHVMRDTVVPTLKNALSVAPIVDEGFTVTVSDGSEWVIV
jgi:hypothetical protein